MNFFCRLLGHTWVPKSEDPKIRWSTSKNLSELDQSAVGTVRLWEECARCGETRNESSIVVDSPAPERAPEGEEAEDEGAAEEVA